MTLTGKKRKRKPENDNEENNRMKKKFKVIYDHLICPITKMHRSFEVKKLVGIQHHETEIRQWIISLVLVTLTLAHQELDAELPFAVAWGTAEGMNEDRAHLIRRLGASLRLDPVGKVATGVVGEFAVP